MATLLDQVVERLRELPQTQQDLAAVEMQSFVKLIDVTPLQLSDEQVAEVDRRRAITNPKTITMAQLDEHISRLSKKPRSSS